MAHFEGLFAVVPALVGIYADGHVGMAAQGFDYFFVVVETHFDLDDLVGRSFLDFFAHLLGVGIIAYGKRCVGAAVGVEAPDFIPGLTHDFAREVVQGDVDRGFGSAVVGSRLVHILVYVFDAEGVGELAKVELGEELGNRVDRLAQVWGHRCLAVAYNAVVFDFDLHAGCRLALRTGKVESVA